MRDGDPPCFRTLPGVVALDAKDWGHSGELCPNDDVHALGIGIRNDRGRPGVLKLILNAYFFQELGAKRVENVCEAECPGALCRMQAASGCKLPHSGIAACCGATSSKKDAGPALVIGFDDARHAQDGGGQGRRFTITYDVGETIWFGSNQVR